MRRISFILCIVLGGCAALHQSRPPIKPSVGIALTGPRQGGDSIQVERKVDQTILHIRSEAGIGGAEIIRKGERWPREMTIRLRFKAMESFSVGNDQVTLRAEIPISNSRLTLREMRKRGVKQSVTVPEGSPYWLGVEVVNLDRKAARRSPIKEGYFQITIPKALLSEATEKLSIQWIDFYR